MFNPNNAVPMQLLVDQPDFQPPQMQFVVAHIHGVLSRPDVFRELGSLAGVYVCILRFNAITAGLYDDIKTRLIAIKHSHNLKGIASTFHASEAQHLTIMCSPQVPLDKISRVFAHQSLQPEKYWLGVLNNVVVPIGQTAH